MTQNKSSAVMQQRTEAHDSLDDFPTPQWAVRALFEHVLLKHGVIANRRIDRIDLKKMRCWEMCANRGYMVGPLADYFAEVLCSDIHNYGVGFPVHDFLMPFRPPQFDDGVAVDWYITNPPFRLAEQIILKALDDALVGVAVIVRSAFEEGIDRYDHIFKDNPPTLMGVFTERVIMHKGVLRDPNKLYLDERTGEMKRPSTATSYKWFVWIKNATPRPQIWIPPCRRQLERPGDYPNG